MVELSLNHTTNEARLVLRPNQSWSWRANLYFLGVLLCLSLTIGVVFAAQGFWLILPYNVLELSCLTAAIWYCVHRGHRQEVITLTPDTVMFERGTISPRPKKTFVRKYNRFFARFQVLASKWSRLRGADKQVSLRCKDEEIEVGAFLSEADRQSLIANLRTGIAFVSDPSRQDPEPRD